MGYENFYPGADSPLTPGSDNKYVGMDVLPTGATVAAGQIGGSTSIQTANQINEVTNMLNSGMKVTEVSTINADVFDMIPLQHLKEISRITKLTGTETTLHAPIIDPSGFDKRGGWSEETREATERQFKDVMERAHIMNGQGNLPVTIHSSEIQGSEHIPLEQVKKSMDLTTKQLQDLEKDYGQEIPTKLLAVNQLNGQIMPLIMEKRYYPGEQKIYLPKKELEIANVSYWDNKLSQLIFNKERGDELLSRGIANVGVELKQIQDVEESYKNKEISGALANKKINQIYSTLSAPQAASMTNIDNAQVYLQNTDQSLNALYNEAYKVANAKTRGLLDAASVEYKKKLGEPGLDISKKSAAMQQIINQVRNITMSAPPEIFKPIEEFATEKGSETLAAVALHAYKKFGDKAPIVSIENPPYGTAISTGSEIKELVEVTREKFAKKAVETGMSKSEAKKAAELMIGVTWDTSHINMMRKQGFGEEKIIEESQKIAPYLKHIHMNDNLGFTHTDLPPGMGIVPFEDIMADLEKGNPNAKKIFEGGNWFQHFKTSPHGSVLQAMNSPIYSLSTGPSWTANYGTMGNYASGYGQFLPDVNFQTYGSGFSLASLPEELGGQMPGRQSRMSGTPMS